jgi:hypothetical protein
MTNNRQFWARWGLILFCWVVIGLFIAGRNIVFSVSRGARIAWDEGVLFELIYYLIWGLFTPVIFWFARRHHIQRLPHSIHRARSVLALLGFGLLVVPLQFMLDFGVATLFARYAFHVPPERIRQIFNSLPRIMLIESFGGLITYAVIVGFFYTLDYYQKFRERELKAAQLEGRLTQADLRAARGLSGKYTG